MISLTTTKKSNSSANTTAGTDGPYPQEGRMAEAMRVDGAAKRVDGKSGAVTEVKAAKVAPNSRCKINGRPPMMKRHENAQRHRQLRHGRKY
jgi:hypothetical protein